MEGWPGDVLSLLTLALHWERRMTFLFISCFLLLLEVSPSLSIYLFFFLCLVSFPWFFFGFSLLSVCPWFRVSPAVAREWPFFTRSCLTIVRHERFCFCEKNRGRKLAPLCTISVLASCCVPGVTSSLEAEKRKRDGGLVG